MVKILLKTINEIENCPIPSIFKVHKNEIRMDLIDIMLSFLHDIADLDDNAEFDFDFDSLNIVMEFNGNHFKITPKRVFRKLK